MSDSYLFMRPALKRKTACDGHLEKRIILTALHLQVLLKALYKHDPVIAVLRHAANFQIQERGNIPRLGS